VSDAFDVDARGMKCPWPVLRAARALRDHASVAIRADDPIAERELQALAIQHGWTFTTLAPASYRIDRMA
jgi:tRNA 2-thiouridine synthesizing protein A